MSNELSDIEIKAEVFRLIRNHSDKSPKVIKKLISEQLPDIENEKIQQALIELCFGSE